MHGYDLLAEYQRQEVIDWASVSKAQLYYALNKLAGAGLIVGQAESTGSRDRTNYSVTSMGRDALSDALADEGWATRRHAQPFTTWLGLSIHAGEDAYLSILRSRQEFLVAEVAKERESLAYVEKLDHDRAKRGADIITLTIAQLEIELEWVGQMLSRDRS